MKKIYIWCRSNRYFSIFAAFLSLLKNESFLTKHGWYGSYRSYSSIDKNGDPIPWYTYSATDFLQNRIKKNMIVFEYGSGNSTKWWASQVAEVVSCEHDESWFNQIQPQLPKNVTYILRRDGDGSPYSTAVQEFDHSFDIIVIDGRDRVQCAANSLASLKEVGVIVWDNSDRNKYDPGYDFLIEQGFRRLDFSGLGPINTYGWTTSVFYRDNNCLGI